MRITVALLAMVVVCAALLLTGRRALRWGAIAEGKFPLIQNLKDFTNGATNFPTGAEGERVFLFTNVVQVGGIKYTCALGLDRPQFKGRGILVVTTNRTFIWIEKDGKAELK